ncbi:MAG TPA: beta-propeller fold lactonase family protein [Candidatus Solibacter sp.]|nr:beta-propeller fold lactonase family protein [Candidatus Solibacter sp.]
MLKRAAALIFAGVSLIGWLSCGKNVSRFLYASVPGADQIVAYREDPNSGILTALTTSPTAAGPAVEAVAIHPSNKFLYAANSAEADISLFTIASSGTITEVTPRTPVGNGVTTPTLLAMDPGGKFLYVGNIGANNPSISVFSIDASTGALAAVAGSPFSIGISPLNMKLSPNGNVLYITAAGSPGYIEVWSVIAGVIQQPVVQVIQPNGNDPYGLAIDPSGAHLYTANTGSNSISEYSISSTDGSLTELTGSPIGETFSAPLALLVDSSGTYLYVANEGSSNLGAFSIGSDGSLTLLTNSPFGTSSHPNFIAQDPNGRFLFVGSETSPFAIQSFSLDPASGTLTAIASYSLSSTPTSITLSQ